MIFGFVQELVRQVRQDLNPPTRYLEVQTIWEFLVTDPSLRQFEAGRAYIRQSRREMLFPDINDTFFFRPVMVPVTEATPEGIKRIATEFTDSMFRVQTFLTPEEAYEALVAHKDAGEPGLREKLTWFHEMTVLEGLKNTVPEHLLVDCQWVKVWKDLYGRPHASRNRTVLVY